EGAGNRVWLRYCDTLRGNGEKRGILTSAWYHYASILLYNQNVSVQATRLSQHRKCLGDSMWWQFMNCHYKIEIPLFCSIEDE
ncbi:MAG: hypothetical protein Q6358_13315, partial [Candidatus Brocadiales bacterium]|nr:hypothetical protein [Candidatus Brocadiales bacterium]